LQFIISQFINVCSFAIKVASRVTGAAATRTVCGHVVWILDCSSCTEPTNDESLLKSCIDGSEMSVRNLSRPTHRLWVGFALGLVVSNIVSSMIREKPDLSPASTSLPLLNLGLSKCDCDKQQERQSSATDEDPSTSINTGTSLPQIVTPPGRHHDHEAVDFDPRAPVVIVTKIQGNKTASQLNQCLCLLTQAYNSRVNYDIVVFTATSLEDYQIQMLEATVAPATLKVVVDNPGLVSMVDTLTGAQKEHLYQRCNVSHSSELTWKTRCREGKTNLPLQYTWQAEFRALHLWSHPVLLKYKYMLWLDSDAFCSTPWERDPISTMIRYDLVLLFDHFPMGHAKGKEWPAKFQEAFGKVICGINCRNGTLTHYVGECDAAKHIRQIYGFFHVTNLDFYRSPPVMKWLQVLIGDSKFSRKYDDQIAVTVPAAVLAGNRSWDMRYHSLTMNVIHNYRRDGILKERVGSFKPYWQKEGPTLFPKAYDKCEIVSNG
jgi:hypothetical protein